MKASGPSEEEITLAVGALLEKHGWQVISLHFPGTQAGVRVRPGLQTDVRGKGALVPDFIARRGAALLVGESKPGFSSGDVRKLMRLVATPAYRPSLSELHGGAGENDLRVLPAIAFAGPVPSRLPRDFIVLAYRGGKLEVAQGWEDLLV